MFQIVEYTHLKNYEYTKFIQIMKIKYSYIFLSYINGDSKKCFKFL